MYRVHPTNLAGMRMIDWYRFKRAFTQVNVMSRQVEELEQSVANLDKAVSKCIDIVSKVQDSHVKLITVVRDVIKRIEPEIVEQGKKLKAFDEMFSVEVDPEQSLEEKKAAYHEKRYAEENED